MKKLIITQIITRLVAIGLILYWFNWKLIPILFIWEYASNIDNIMKAKREKKKDITDILLKIINKNETISTGIK